jgi:hypothetical protein
MISSATPAWVLEIEANYNNDAHYTSLIQQIVVNNQDIHHYSVHLGILRYKEKILH